MMAWGGGGRAHALGKMSSMPTGGGGGGGTRTTYTFITENQCGCEALG